MIINNPTPPTQSVTVSSVPSPLSVTLGDNSDSNAPLGANSMLAVLARLQAYDGANFDRLQMRNMTDAVPGTLNSLLAAAQLMGYNGSTMDRIRADNIGGAGALRVTSRGFSYTGSVLDTSAHGAGTATQLIAPSSNTNGLIIWRSALQSFSSANGGAICLLAKSSAPTTLVDGDELDALFYEANIIVRSNYEQPVFVSSGKGVYTYNDSAQTANQTHLLYSIL